MRLDRCLTLTLAYPLQRLGRAVVRGRVPVLMYHSISDEAEPEPSPYYKVNTSPAVFRQHLEWLAGLGYCAVGLSHALQALCSQRVGRQPLVAITFDDGFRDFYTEALPALESHGFGATVFLPTGFIGENRLTFRQKECLLWSEVREARRRGIEFGSHTLSHPRLTDLSWKAIEHELRASKAELEQRLGEPITAFAHPYAFPQTDAHYVEHFRELLIAAGYACCATTAIGRVRPGDDPFLLKRLPMNSLDDAALFRAKLAGAYDWLAWPQAWSKRVKNRLRAPQAVSGLAPLCPR
jgi:peptidoglycan/xylan/chitin deacetylase (PgdA/CDA1 family)